MTSINGSIYLKCILFEVMIMGRFERMKQEELMNLNGGIEHNGFYRWGDAVGGFVADLIPAGIGKYLKKLKKFISYL